MTYKHITWDDRLKIEALLKANVPVSKIAKIVGFHRSTIYREIKRGRYLHELDYYDEERYSPEIAQRDYEIFFS